MHSFLSTKQFISLFLFSLSLSSIVLLLLSVLEKRTSFHRFSFSVSLHWWPLDWWSWRVNTWRIASTKWPVANGEAHCIPNHLSLFYFSCHCLSLSRSLCLCFSLFLLCYPLYCKSKMWSALLVQLFFYSEGRKTTCPLLDWWREMLILHSNKGWHVVSLCLCASHSRVAFSLAVCAVSRNTRMEEWDGRRERCARCMCNLLSAVKVVTSLNLIENRWKQIHLLSRFTREHEKRKTR